jgi:hypothetical protein
MRRARAVLALSVLTLLAACNDNQPALPPMPEKQEKLTRFEFTIGDVQYAISLPEEAAIREYGTSGVIFYARWTQREQKTLLLLPTARNPDRNFDQEHVPRDEHDRPVRDRTERIVRYRHLGNTGAGSGGSIEDIAGRIQIGRNVLFFECSDQGEWSIRPTWCLGYLDSLEVTQPSSGNG